MVTYRSAQYEKRSGPPLRERGACAEGLTGLPALVSAVRQRLTRSAQRPASSRPHARVPQMQRTASLKALFTNREFMSKQQISNYLASSQLSIKQLRDGGFRASELREYGYSVANLRVPGGYSVDELLEGGFRAYECKQSGVSARRLRKAGYSAAELKEAWFSASQLKAAGYSAEALKSAGFSAADLAVGGFSASELKQIHFKLDTLKAAGFDPSELTKAGYSMSDLKSSGFDWSSLKVWCHVDGAGLRRLGYLRDPHELHNFWDSHPEECRAAGITVVELMNAGVDKADLKSRGDFTAAEIEAGVISSEATSTTPAEKPSAASNDGATFTLPQVANAAQFDVRMGRKLHHTTQSPVQADRNLLERVLNDAPRRPAATVDRTIEPLAARRRALEPAPHRTMPRRF